MAIKSARIEEICDKNGIPHFVEPGKNTICIPCGGDMAFLTLSENGKFLWISSSPLFYPKDFPEFEQRRMMERLMEKNNRIKLGRFCGTSVVTFEIGLPIEDGDLSAQQFIRCMESVEYAMSVQKVELLGKTHADGAERILKSLLGRLRQRTTSPANLTRPAA